MARLLRLIRAFKRMHKSKELVVLLSGTGKAARSFEEVLLGQDDIQNFCFCLKYHQQFRIFFQSFFLSPSLLNRGQPSLPIRAWSQKIHTEEHAA